jgi:hypothetical protein
MSIPSGSGSNGVFSITTSALETNRGVYKLLLEGTISLCVNLLLRASRQYAPNRAMSQDMCQITAASERGVPYYERNIDHFIPSRQQ